MVKFLICAEARSGSNYLVSLLSKVPNTICRGEYIIKNPHLKYDRLYNNKKNIGFKAIQGQLIARTRLLNFLKEHPEIKIIRLFRINKLAQFVSLKKSIKTKYWVITCQDQDKYNTLKNCTVKINYQKFLQYVSRLEQENDSVNRIFKNHEMIYITYESLCDNKETMLLQISDFLNIPIPNSLTASTVKTSRSLKEMIINYDEIQQKFRNGKFERFLQD